MPTVAIGKAITISEWCCDSINAMHEDLGQPFFKGEISTHVIFLSSFTVLSACSIAAFAVCLLSH